MKMILDLGIIFLLFTLIMFLLLSGYASKKRMDTRMADYLGHEEEKKAEESKEQNKPPFLQRIYQSAANLFKNVQFSEKTEQLLFEAGSPLKPEEYFAARVFVAAGAGIIAVLFGLTWYICLAALIVGFELPVFFVKRKRRKRLELLSYQLIDALEMMANSMRAGFSFMQALQMAGKEIPDPLGPEFDRAFRQTGLGKPLDAVFAELIERLPSKELEVVLDAILAQRKSGGNLSELMETMEETIRGRVRVLEELKTLTAEGRLSARIITLLPIGLALYLALVNKEYFQPMLESPLGLAMLTGGAVCIIIGWILIKKITNIEV